MKGKFITIEGIEGVGKSSHVQFIRDFLKKSNYNVTTTREPGGTEVAEAIREILLKHFDESIHDETEMLLLFSGRIQHVNNVIKPALENDRWVVCDRYLDATLAYQGGGRNISQKHILFLYKWLFGDFMPDLTILLDAPVDIALGRIKQRSLDRIEKETKSFFERTRRSYLSLAKQFPKRIKVIDASKDIHDVQKDIKVLLENWI
jgi:dTMP kinase